jgi:hypothetical protein
MLSIRADIGTKLSARCGAARVCQSMYAMVCPYGQSVTIRRCRSRPMTVGHQPCAAAARGAHGLRRSIRARDDAGTPAQTASPPAKASLRQNGVGRCIAPPQLSVAAFIKFKGRCANLGRGEDAGCRDCAAGGRSDAKFQGRNATFFAQFQRDDCRAASGLASPVAGSGASLLNTPVENRARLSTALARQACPASQAHPPRR